MRVLCFALVVVLFCVGGCDSLALEKLQKKAVAHGQKVAHTLAAKVGTQVFAYEAASGALSMAISKTPTPLSDQEWADLKAHSWHDVVSSSPLKALGYEAWQPTKDGIRFKHKEGEDVVCHSSQGRSSETSTSVLVGFDCQFGTAPQNALLESNSKEEPNAEQTKHEGDFAGYLDRDDYDDHQKGEMWVPAENGVPYGWNKLFASFGFPYFTVTPKGYLGCYKLVHGMCSMTPTSFASTMLQPPLKKPADPPARLDLTPKFPHGTDAANYDDLRTDPDDVTYGTPLPDSSR